MTTFLSQQMGSICRRLPGLMIGGLKKSPSIRTVGDLTSSSSVKVSSRQLEVSSYVLRNQFQLQAGISRHLGLSPSQLNSVLEYNLPTTCVNTVIQKGEVTESNVYECPKFISENSLSNSIMDPSTEKEIMAPQQDNVEKVAKNVLKIRRRKMNRHHLKKLRKRMKFVFRKRLHRKLKLKEARLQEEFRAIMKRAEDFDPKEFVQKNLELARKGGFHVNIFESSRQQH